MSTLRSLHAFAVAALLAAPAAATTISFQNGFDGYDGADNDSFSFDGTITQNQIRLDLPNAAQPDGSYAWMIFEDIVGPGAVPEGATVLSATIEAFVRNPFDAAQVTRLLAPIQDRPFGPGESVLDAAGAFWDDSQLVGIAHGPCSDAVECIPPLPISIDVSAIVQAWVDGEANHGFLFLPLTTNGGKLFTTNAVDPELRPRLVITYDASGVSVPEPALLALVGLALALRRRA
jgi:hypothetical protein